MVASQLLDVGFLSFAVTLRASRRIEYPPE